MGEKAIEAIIQYGDARFGDAWWPQNSRTWLGEKAALELEDKLKDPTSDPDGTVDLLMAYGEAKFGDKWRPASEAAKYVDSASAEELSVYLANRREMAPAF